MIKAVQEQDHKIENIREALAVIDSLKARIDRAEAEIKDKDKAITQLQTILCSKFTDLWICVAK